MNCNKDILFIQLKRYSNEEAEKIKMAYFLAEKLHEGQIRKSGEPYIIHPVNVAYILTELNADADTICAGLLHDTLEDTNISKDELTELFGPTVAELVDGVTKISGMHFRSKREKNLANTRKILSSLTSDVRIIIVKLADRLHNMRTLEFHNLDKQKEIALETMEIFVPLANLVGSYWLKNELEDLSLKFLKPDEYKRIAELSHYQETGFYFLLEEMKTKIGERLKSEGINSEIQRRIKNIYGIYKRFDEGYELDTIPDLLALKVIVEDVKDCYLSLWLIHDMYHPLNCRFKDYICTPKSNMYRSLHTTVFGEGDKLIQTRIRTFEMDNIAYNGLTANWNLKNNQERIDMQKYFKDNFKAYNSLREIDKMFTNNDEFIEHVRSELFSDKIYVYSPKGEMIELPKGATPGDYAYLIHTELGNNMRGVFINGVPAPINTQLKTGDMVKIITTGINPSIVLPDDVITARAKRKIKEKQKK